MSKASQRPVLIVIAGPINNYLPSNLLIMTTSQMIDKLQQSIQIAGVYLYIVT